MRSQVTMSRKKKFVNKRAGKFLTVSVIILFLVLLVCGILIYLKESYDIKTVLVEGNTHYTDSEIEELVLDEKFLNNSLLVSANYKNKEITGIPFVETIDVSIVSKDTVKITVHEKALAGFIEYLGRYIYFDKDGIVVESSNIKTEGVPEVVGIEFDYVVLYEPLPATDQELFKKVLNITQLMTKYDVYCEKMYFADNGEIKLFKDDITIDLGKDENIDVKIMNLKPILEKLEGKKGTLKMENYDETTKRVSFETVSGNE